MAQQKFIYYKNKITSGKTPLEVINEVREDYNINTDFSFNLEYQFSDIPFNIEQEYLMSLIDEKKYNDAKKLIEDMKHTYRNANYLNFIEVYEYHLNAVMHAEKSIKDSIIEAKKDFNQHTITIVTVIVGVVTLLGTANQAFTVSNFNEGMKTFWSITAAVILVIIITFALNNNKR